MTFTAAQIDQLLHPINPKRVLRDGKGMAHVSQQDVLAHLVRVFGFGGFDTEMLSLELVFEMPNTSKREQGRYDVCYRATMRLTVRDPEGRQVCRYENGSTGDAQNLTRAEAHDLAMKSAISLAVKRCAIALGDQFGLSLYNKGQMSALVLGTLVRPDQASDEPVGDVQEGVPQQVALGNDETDYEPTPTRSREYDELLDAIEKAPDVDTLRELWRDTNTLLGEEKEMAQKLINARLEDLKTAGEGA